ncbi:methyl-accepting chemotaxis protein [Paenibacillus sp. YIM B09110]|uniref:methyl-accepting chemotaxis protein n=1 Tax=Paenibacillus sp. YIM B09110 TaxID=3126102 RepID=UPI00301D6FED
MKSLRLKLFTGFGVLLVMIVAIVIVCYVNVEQFVTKVETTIEHDVKLLSYDEKLSKNVQERIALVRGYLLFHEEDYKTRFLASTEESKEVQEYILSTAHSDEVESLIEQSKSWRENIESTLFPAIESGNDELALQILQDTVTPIGRELSTGFDELAAKRELQTQEASQSVLRHGKTLELIIVIIAAVAIVLGILLAIMMSGMIVGPVLKIATRIRMISEGDLRGDVLAIRSKDEVGQLSASVNHMVERLRDLLGSTVISSQSVAAASEQISASMQQMASTSISQSQSTQTVNELFMELSNSIHDVAASAEEAAELSEKTSAIATQGGNVVIESIEGMNVVNTKMSALEQDSSKIGDIISVIEDISSQTNLLALNAAIEAARAGDQGRGFAVVANEVRKLAERSSDATKQITVIIKGMQSNTVESVRSVSEAMQQSKQIGQAFDNIIHMVNESSSRVTNIAAACEEQVAQSSTVFRSVQEISAASQQTAASSEETAATSQSLAALAEQMNESINIFKLA